MELRIIVGNTTSAQIKLLVIQLLLHFFIERRHAVCSFCFPPVFQKLHNPITEHGEQNHDCKEIRKEEHSQFTVIEKGKGPFQK